MNPKPFRVIPCAEWGARPPKHAIQGAGKPSRAIYHHTAGHALGFANGESYEEAVAYARSVQNYHMGHNGWSDSGHNFLVTRNGYIFEGRHGSLAAIKAGKMVVSAHCPGQNEQPGIEHEQVDPEPLTPIQHDASVWLFAWICKQCSIPATHIFGHRDFFATSCPGSLYVSLPSFRLDVADALKPPKPKPAPKPKTSGYWMVTKTFYDGHEGPAEKVKSARVWALKQGDLVKKGVRNVEWHWVETG